MTLSERSTRTSVRSWLAEDVGRGDITTMVAIDPGLIGSAEIRTRSKAVVAGLEVARVVFDEVDPTIDWTADLVDGETAAPGDRLVSLHGPLRSLLTGERTALNILAHLSGIATTARAFAEAVAGTGARVVDTRKTTPGLRVMEKYAVRTGGCHNHRSGLDDGILIKDNHVAAAGGIAVALKRAKEAAPHGLAIEIEVVDLAGLQEAIEAGADGVLLDNMDPPMVGEAVQLADGRVWLEASGGITLENVAAFAQTGVDLISVGALTHSAPHIDLTMEIA